MRAYSSISAKKPSCTVSHIMVTSLGSKWAAGKGSVSAGRRIGVSASQETRFRNVWHGSNCVFFKKNKVTRVAQRYAACQKKSGITRFARPSALIPFFSGTPLGVERLGD